MGTREEVMAALTSDGDTYTDKDGRVWMLTMPSDEDSSLMDEQGEGMWCGRLEWVDDHRNKFSGYAQRPLTMNGRARKIIANQMHGAVWWQVPADIADENIPAMAATISNILAEYPSSVVSTMPQ